MCVIGVDDPLMEDDFLTLLRSRPLCLGEVIHLGQTLRLPGWPPMTKMRLTERSSSLVRLDLYSSEKSEFPETPDTPTPAHARCRSSLSPTTGDSGKGSTVLHCKVLYQESGEELAALRLLHLLNGRWSREKLCLFQVPVQCPLYGAVVLGDGLMLLEEPDGVTLADLKRSCGEHTRTRVSDFLCRDPQKLSKLAATCAAMLAASYVLGASAGDGDTLRLLPDGSLLRTDLVGLFGRGALLDAPPVWLPKAVTCALGGRWPEVQQMASLAFQVALTALAPLPPPKPRLIRSWAKGQALLLRMEHLLHLPTTEYLSTLSLADFQSALSVADDTIGKRVSSVLHDFFGYRCAGGSWLESQMGRTPEQEVKAEALRYFLAAEEQEASATSLSLLSLPWAFTCPSWTLAVRIVAALCGEPEELLHLHCEDMLILARQGDDVEDGAWHRKGALRSLANLVKHSGAEVCGWLADCCSGGAYPPTEVFELTRILRSMAVPSRDALAPSGKDTFLLELGAICALARLHGSTSPGPRRSALPETFAELAPLVAAEAACARRIAAQSVVTLMTEDDRPSLTELGEHLPGVDLAVALRSLHREERFCAVRGLEQEAKAGAELCRLARQCLAALAQDAEAQVSQPALCAIACAVHDDNDEVRQWARKFLTDASWAPSGEEGSIHFFVRMVRNMVGVEVWRMPNDEL